MTNFVLGIYKRFKEIRWDMFIGILCGVYASFKEVRNGLAIAALLAIVGAYPAYLAAVVCVLFVWLPKDPRKSFRLINYYRRKAGSSKRAYYWGVSTYLVAQVGIAIGIGLSAEIDNRFLLAGVCLFCKYVINYIVEEEIYG